MFSFQPPLDDCGKNPPIFNSAVEPICIVTRACGQKQPNVFYNDPGFSDQLYNFDVILHSIDRGCNLCKRKHPAPTLNNVDPTFLSIYNEAKHGQKLHSKLNILHLDKLLKPLSIVLFKIIGLCLMIRASSSLLGITHASLVQALSVLLRANALLPSKNWITSGRSTMVNGF